MKKLSDFIISYVTEASLGTGGSFYYMPAAGGASAPTSSPAPATSYSPSVVSDNPDYDFQSRLGGMVKAKTKESEELLNRMRRVAARQEAAGGVDPGVASKIAELEDQLSPAGQSRIRGEEARKLESGIERVKAGKQFSNLPSGMFKTTPKTAAEQEAYDAAKDAMTLLMKRDEDKKTGAAGFSDDSAVESAFQISREKSAAVDAERKSASKISPVYQVTQGDFKTATGQDYDPRNPQHRQTFFDLASRGAPTWSATAGVGEGPAYGSQAFYAMRGRPQNIPQFGTPEAWYDTETGQLARTTEKSRERTAEKQAIEKINDRENKLNAVTDFVVNWNYPNRPELATTPEPARAPEPAAAPKPAPAPQDNFPFDVEKGQFPIFPKRASKFGQALNKAAENVIGSVGPKVSDFIKRNLAQTTPNAMREKLYGTTDVPGAVPVPNQDRGQFPIFSEPAPAPKPAPTPQDNFPFDVERGQFPIQQPEDNFPFDVERGQFFLDPEDWTKLYGYETGNPFIPANAFGGEPTVSLKPDDLPGIKPKANVAKSAKDYMDKVLLRKYRKPSKSEKQGLENFLSPEQIRQLFSGRGNLQGLDNFLTPEQQKQLFAGQTNKQVRMAPNVRIEVPGMADSKQWAMSKLDPRQREEEDGEGIMGSRGVPGRELSIPDEEEPRRSPRRR